jgi:uncharacterized membrane protein YcaP (DUF421 family)
LEPSGELSVIQNDTREDLQLQKQMSKLLAEVASLRSAIEQYQDRSTKNKKSSKK